MFSGKTFNKIGTRIAVIISAILFLSSLGAAITQLSRLSYTEEVTAVVIDRDYKHDDWYITIVYNYRGTEYKKQYQNSHHRVGDEITIILKEDNPGRFYEDDPTLNLSYLFSYIISGVWFGGVGVMILIMVISKKVEEKIDGCNRS